MFMMATAIGYPRIVPDQQRAALRNSRLALTAAVARVEAALLSAAAGREAIWRGRVVQELDGLASALDNATRIAGPADDLHHEIAEVSDEFQREVLQLQRQVDYLPRWLEWFRGGIDSTTADSVGVGVVRDEALRIVSAIKRMQALEADLALAALGINLETHRR